MSGDVSGDLAGTVMREFVRQASVKPLGKLLIVAAGYGTFTDAQADLDTCARAVVRAGWRGLTRGYVYGQALLDPSQGRHGRPVPRGQPGPADRRSR